MPSQEARRIWGDEIAESKNYVWDPNTLGWVAMQQPFLQAGQVTIIADLDSIIAKMILGEFKISDVDAAGSPNYYGFLDASGNWYIIKETVAAPDTYRYVKGAAGYAAAWTSRASQTYGYFDAIF